MRFNSIMTTIVAFLPTMALSKVVKSNSRTPATCTCVAYADEYAATGTANGISFKWCPSSYDTTDGSRRPSTYSSGIAGVYSCCEWTMLYSNVGHTCSFSTAMSCPYGNKGTKRESNVHYNICMTEKEKDDVLYIVYCILGGIATLLLIIGDAMYSLGYRCVRKPGRSNYYYCTRPSATTDRMFLLPSDDPSYDTDVCSPPAVMAEATAVGGGGGGGGGSSGGPVLSATVVSVVHKEN